MTIATTALRGLSRRLRIAAVFLAAAATLPFASPSFADSAPLKIGTATSPQIDALKIAVREAKEQGLDVKLIEFTDWNTPNAALANKDIDVNYFQHVPFLENAKKQGGYDFVAIAPGTIMKIGLYSKKVKRFDELKDGATVAIANDPVNGGRGLLLLQRAGLINLKPGADYRATTLDIVENPKHLKIRELEAATLPRVLDDVDLALINTNYALAAGLDPTRDALFIEGADSPYANLIAARNDNVSSPALRKLVDALRSPAARKFIQDKYHGAVVATF